MSEKKAEKIWDSLNKAIGTTKIFRADEHMSLVKPVINLPTPALGEASHYWGLPLGQISQFHGPEGSGKTFLAMLCVKEAQKQFPTSEVVWIDAEYSFNAKWAKQMGIDISRLRIIPENNAAEIFTIILGKSNDKGKKIQPGILDLIPEGHLDVKLIVLDSIASLIPPVEENRGLDEQEMSALARFLPKTFRRATSALSKANCSLLCINQAREKMGERIPTLTYPGGRAYRHLLSLSIALQASTASDNVLFADAAKTKKIGHKILARVEKTRNGPDKHRAEFFLDFTRGVVQTGLELADLGEAYGVLDRPSGNTWGFKDVKTGRGKNAFAALLDENEELKAELLTKIKEAKDSGKEKDLSVLAITEEILPYEETPIPALIESEE